MAHQGLNDIDIQKALYNVYTTMCPELHFIAPHLLKFDKSNIEAKSSGAYALYKQKDQQIPVKIAFVSAHMFDHSIGR